MGVEFSDRAAYFPAADALVLADLHVGRDAQSRVELPLGERESLTRRLASLLSTFEPATVVFAGDVLHAFSTIPDGAEETLSELKSLVDGAGANLVVLRGNHDAMLPEAYDGEVREKLRLADGETVVLHGHEAPSADADRYVVGHDHPAIAIEGRKRPCYLFGSEAYQGADVLMVPAFTRLAPGTTINDRWGSDFQSPLLTDGIPFDEFRPIVRDEDAEETLTFPPLGEFRRAL